MDLAFFIDTPFVRSCSASADDADRFTTLDMGHNKKPTGRRHAKGDEPVLSFRMVGVGARHCQRVIKDTCSLFKRDPMLAETLSTLGRVPFKMHAPILPLLLHAQLPSGRLRAHHLEEVALLAEQGLRRAFFDHLAVADRHHAVDVGHHGLAVGDDQRRASSG